MNNIEALLRAHDYVCRDIGNAEMNREHNMAEGHLNGLKEGRNRIEQAIIEEIENDA